MLVLVDVADPGNVGHAGAHGRGGGRRRRRVRRLVDRRVRPKVVRAAAGSLSACRWPRSARPAVVLDALATADRRRRGQRGEGGQAPDAVDLAGAVALVLGRRPTGCRPRSLDRARRPARHPDGPPEPRASTSRWPARCCLFEAARQRRRRPRRRNRRGRRRGGNGLDDHRHNRQARRPMIDEHHPDLCRRPGTHRRRGRPRRPAGRRGRAVGKRVSSPRQERPGRPRARPAPPGRSGPERRPRRRRRPRWPIGAASSRPTPER